MGLKPVSVSQLNGYIKRILGTDPILMNISVYGEISGLIKHGSGHWYFSLKDAGSSVKCFLPSDRARGLRYEIAEGMQVTAHGYVSVYERGGYYSFNIRDIDVEGEGELAKAFESLKKKLQAEGLFSDEHKRPIPPFPSRIGVVSSASGAAIKDIINAAQRRSSLVDILVYPCTVQGPGSAESVAGAIYELNEKFPELDLLIVGRGGGSAEDLWTFNEECVARAVYNSRIPVISAVGHERDLVISDLAADLRAATPTAAAELAVPHMDVLYDILRSCSPQRMFGYIYEQLQNAHLRTEHLKADIEASVDRVFSSYEHRLRLLKSEIDSLSPELILKKGYVIAGAGDRRLSSASELSAGDRLWLRFHDGYAECDVVSTEVLNG